MDRLIRPPTPFGQHGVVMPLAAIAMLAIIAMAGLALDMGHAYWNKTKLQNALDAAALSGAKALSDGASQTASTAAAIATFNEHAQGEMEGVVPTITFSELLAGPYLAPDVPNARFVRASVADFEMGVWLIRVLGFGPTETIGGSAVAGPVQVAPCDIVPLVVCAKEDPDGNVITDCDDETCMGYPVGQEQEVGLAYGTPPNCPADSPLPPGNYQLLRLDGAGANVLRRNLAGGYEGCAATDDEPDTQPGVDAGPVGQGLNRRFGDPAGPLDPAYYPPDTVTFEDYNDGGACDIGENYFWHSDYLSRQANGPLDNEPIWEGGTGVPGRRMLTVPMGICSTDPAKPPVIIKHMGCFYMTRRAKTTGPINERYVYGQLVGQSYCRASGPVAENPTGGEPTKIVLYKDPDSQDS